MLYETNVKDIKAHYKLYGKHYHVITVDQVKLAINKQVWKVLMDCYQTNFFKVHHCYTNILHYYLLVC